MIRVRVKFGKDVHEIDVDTTAPSAAFKTSLEQATGVPAARQKITGLKVGQLKDDTNMADVGLSATKPLLLIGSAEVVPVKPTAPVVFAEDAPQTGHATDEVMSNGLVNLGNTCYLNSVVQLLRTIPEYREKLAAMQNPVAKALLALFVQLDTTRGAVQPILFWTSFMSAFPTFAGTNDHGYPMQHDSQEALTSLLEAAGEIGPSASPLFAGLTAATEAEGATQFSMINCSITGEVQILETGIERGLMDSAGVPRKFERLPQYVLIHMHRFAWRADISDHAKVLRPVSFPMVLDLQPFCTDSVKKELEPARVVALQRRDIEMARRKKSKQKSGQDDVSDLVHLPENLPPGPDPLSGYYELAGIVSHKGRTLNGGHYVSWARKGDAWLLFDDDNVGQVTTEDILRLRGVGEAHIAYVLLYRCRDPTTGFAPYPQ